jgi:hypothetical protein
MNESIRDTLAREAAEAEARAEAEERGEVAPAPGGRGRKRAKDPSQVYPVRIPVSKLRRLREIAEERDMQPTVLIRQWVTEKLDEVDNDGHDEASRASEEQAQRNPSGLKLGPRRQRAASLSGDPYREQVRRHA